MQPIIMAGGEGTRLRPMTCNMPKPLAPLLGRPVIEYILELLKKNSFDKATISLLYQGEKIENHFDESEHKGVELDFCYETTPLGTAGCVKLCSSDSDVLVISGDAMCDFDLKSIIDFHYNKKAEVTIVVKKVSDPREYGLVLCDDDGKITGFLEKPSYESCTTDLANTGVYVISKRVIDMIEDGKKLDFAGDIFPQLMDNNIPIFAYEEKGYWCDIGDFKSYIRCQQDMIEGRVMCDIYGHRELDGVIVKEPMNLKGVRISAPAYIGKNVSIGTGSVIESGSIIGDNVTIGQKSKIHGSIILDNAFIGDRVCCNEAIICRNTKVLGGASAFENTVLGENVTVGTNAVIEAGSRIWPGKSIDSNTSVSYDVKYGYTREIVLDDEGFCGEINGTITTKLCSDLGSSLASTVTNKIVAIGHNSQNASSALALSFISGGMSSGADVYDFGECTFAQLIFCMNKIGAELGCFIDVGVTARVRIVSENGLMPTRAQERKIEAGINRNEFKKVPISEFGRRIYSVGMISLYENYIKSLITSPLKGIRPEYKTSCPINSEVIKRCIVPKSDNLGEQIIFNLSSDGTKVSAYNEKTGYVFYERLLLLGVKISLAKNGTVSVPYSFPEIGDYIAEKLNKRLLRYFNCSCGSKDAEARSSAKNSTFVTDSIELTAIILSYISKKNSTFAEVLSEVPNFHSHSRFVSVEASPSKVLKKFATQKAGLSEGVIYKENDGRALIRPIKTGKGIMLFVESYKSETAKEICDNIEKLIKNDEKTN